MKWEPTRWSDASSGTSAALRSALRELREQPVDMQAVQALTERMCSQQLPADKPSMRSQLPAGKLQLGKWFFTCAGLLLLEPEVVEPAVVVHSPLVRERRDFELQPELQSEHAQPQVRGRRDFELQPELQPEHVQPQAAAAPSVPPSPPRVRARKSKHRVQPLEPRAAAESSIATQDELTLLQAAQSVLDHDAQRALDLTRQHARDFPAGLFGQEREILALEALLKLAHTREADARALAFLRACPSSPHARRVRALLERNHTGSRSSE